jgi:putative ABC transport system permease protein
MTNFLRDLRYAARMLASSPGFTAAAVLCLALGIGATSAIFSVVHAVLMRPLSYREPDRLIRLYTEFPKASGPGQHRFWTSPPEYLELAHDLHSWESLDAWMTSGANLAGAASPIRVTGTFITGGLMPSLGVSPELGRAITPADDVDGAPGVVVISHGLWQRTYGGDPTAVGRVVQVNGRNTTIVGVMPAAFAFPPGDLDPTEIWAPLQLGLPNPRQRAAHFLYVLGRLKPGVSLRQAQDEIAIHVRDSAKNTPTANHPFSPDNHPIVSYPLHEEVVRGIRPALLTLLCAVAFVLLIACVNVANLLLARAEARQREIAIRKALGAGMGRLIRQFTIEGLLLSLTGAALGVGLAAASLRWMIASGQASIPRASEVSIDPMVLSVTLAVSLLTALCFGFAPLAQIVAGSLHDALKAAAGRARGSVSSNRFRSVLVASELALALMLLIGAGLMVRAFWKLTEVNPGFRSDNLLTLRINLPRATYPQQANVIRFWKAVQEKAGAVPGVVSATAMRGLPPERRVDSNDAEIEGFVAVPNGPGNSSDYYQDVGDHFFETLGVRLIEGRLFDERDGEGGPPSLIINRAMAHTYYGNQSPIGRRIRPEFTDPWRTIVGVVEDVKNGGLDKPAGTELYFSVHQPGPDGVDRTIYLAIRGSGDPKPLIAGVRAAVSGIDPSLPLSQVRTMDEVLDSARTRPRFLTTLLSLFSATALILAAVGLYGVISYSVTRRTAEFGIRMAMGAQSGDVFRLVIGQGLRLALAGVGAGAIGALALTRMIRGLLFGVSSFDPATFLAMAILLTAVTIAACVIPARRAVRVDPLTALRNE